MPLYDFRCKTCETTFEVRRPMAEASDPATCPQGHENAVRLLSVFASVGASSGSDRVIRGGSWFSDARDVRAACRDGDDPGHAVYNLGFRPLSAASRPAE